MGVHPKMKVDTVKKQDLYIATRSDRSDIVKIGRSCDVKKRCANLSSSHCFTVNALYVYKGCGEHEKAVHRELQRHRIEGGSGTEWFKITAIEAHVIVNRLLPNAPLVDNSSSYSYELTLAELGMGPYPSEPASPKRRRKSEASSPKRRRRSPPEWCDSYRPPQNDQEALEQIMNRWKFDEGVPYSPPCHHIASTRPSCCPLPATSPAGTLHTSPRASPPVPLLH